MPDKRRKAILAAYDKEAADLRADLEVALDEGKLDADDPYEMRIVILPGVIRCTAVEI